MFQCVSISAGGSLFSPEKAHFHLVRAGGSPRWSPPPSPSVATRPDPRGPPLPTQSGLAPAILPVRNLRSSSCQARWYFSPRLCTGCPPSSHHSPPHSSAQPHPYCERGGAETTAILQAACLSVFRHHMNHTGQTKAQRLLGSRGQRPGVLGRLLLHPSQCPLLLPHGPPGV